MSGPRRSAQLAVLRRLRSGDPARPTALLTLVFALPPVRLAQLIAGATATSAQGRSGVETAG